MIKELVLVTASYPTKEDPVYAFIRPIACGLADLGIHVIVLSPQSITNTIKRKVKLRPKHWIDISNHGKIIDVYQPKYLSISMIKMKGQVLSIWLFEKAVKKVINGMKKKPDLVYAHFWQSAVAASYAIDNRKIPIVAVSGESRISVFEIYPKQKVIEAKQKVKGLICVSTKNLEECKELGLVTSKMKTVILPNAINPAIFRKLNKLEMREKLKISKDEVVVAYVGEFTKRKGVNRLLEASKRFPGIKLVLIGNGDPLIDSDQIIFSGIVAHDEVPEYLNAADFFVLPTLAEGCCNAIIEAMACGLPIISSDLPFNYDVLNEENSILIDPNNVDQIADAIGLLVNDVALRNRLSEGALSTASSLTINTRVGKIYDFINNL